MFTCEKAITPKKLCGNPATLFVMGRHRCAAHIPRGAKNCSHSLAPSGRCSYCGAPA